MKAIVLEKFGGYDAFALRDVPVPAVGPRQVRVRVHATAINPLDYQIRRGDYVDYVPLPAIIGHDISGVVEEKGADASGFEIGDEVYYTPRIFGGPGSYAEQHVVDVDLVARKPNNISHLEAASLTLVGGTIWEALVTRAQLAVHETILIHGGAGGVGTVAIQLAKAMGARVITTARSGNHEFVRSLGADEVIDYTTERFQDRVSGMDGAFDLMGGETLDATFGVVRPGGIVVSIAGLPEPQTARKDLNFGPLMTAVFWFVSRKLRALARRRGVRYRFLFMRPSGAELGELAGLVAAGRLEPVVDRVFPFAEIAAAMDYLETGRAKGKVIVRMVD